MQATVTLLTDRSGFPQLWRAALEQQELATAVCAPDEIASVQPGVAVVIDATSTSFDEDELLTAVGFLRAVGALPVVHLAGNDDTATVDDVIEEMCEGRIVREPRDVARIAAALPHRLDDGRRQRFEFVTISPRDAEVLAILGDGSSLLMRRPLDGADDGSDVISIALAEDARTATLALGSGATIELDASAMSARAPSASRPSEGPGGAPIDGARLGARLRELRLEAGLTQAELARRTGIHRPNIARVEAGRHTPSLDTLQRLANAIGVPTSRVLCED